MELQTSVLYEANSVALSDSKTKTGPTGVQADGFTPSRIMLFAEAHSITNIWRCTGHTVCEWLPGLHRLILYSVLRETKRKHRKTRIKKEDKKVQKAEERVQKVSGDFDTCSSPK